MTRTPARGALLAALAVVVWLAATASLRPLTLPDEGRYVGVAFEMLRSGEWLTPTLDGLPYFHKPPLFYWITAASLAVFGVNQWAARLAPLLGALFAAASLYLFVRRWADERSARTSLLVLLTMPFFFIAAQFANLDMLVAGCIAASVLSTAHAVLAAESELPARRALIGGYAAAGFGVLAKGLIGFVLPALVILVWLAASRRMRLLTRLLSLPGLLVLLAIAAPWFVAMQSRYPAFFDYFFVVQHFKRFAESGFNNAQPFWFLPAVVAVLCLPWSPWLGFALRKRVAASSPLRSLMVVWFAVVLLFFSLPNSKLVGYVLPALPPLAFLIADVALGGRLAARGRRAWQASAALAAATCVGAAGALAVFHPPTSRPLAIVLAERRAAGEPVYFLNGYYFDVAFYGRVAEPIGIADDWHDPSLHERDNWRKELFDAGGFAPERAARTLLDREQLPIALCRVPVGWVFAPPQSGSQHSYFRQADIVAATPRVALWRIDSRRPETFSALGCRGKPNADSTDK